MGRRPPATIPRTLCSAARCFLDCLAHSTQSASPTGPGASLQILIGLLPFILLQVLRGLLGPQRARLVSAALAGATLGWQAYATSPKSLTVATFVLIGAAAVVGQLRPLVAETWAGVLVDGGLTVFVLAGVALGTPFTLEWARESVPAQYWTHPLFLSTTTTISLAWGAGFLVLTVLALPVGLPFRPWQRRFAAIAVMLAATAFTAWYPGHVQQAAAAQARVSPNGR